MVNPDLMENTLDRTKSMILRYRRLWPMSSKQDLINAILAEEVDVDPLGDLRMSTGPDSFDELMESMQPENIVTKKQA